MKKAFAATAAAALMAATGAWAQGTAGQTPGAGSPMGVTPSTPSHAAGGAQTMGPEGAPGPGGTQAGSSADSSPESGGTGQPGTGKRSIDQNNPTAPDGASGSTGSMGGSSGSMGGGASGTGSGATGGSPPGGPGTGAP